MDATQAAKQPQMFKPWALLDMRWFEFFTLATGMAPWETRYEICSDEGQPFRGRPSTMACHQARLAQLAARPWAYDVYGFLGD
jgi:hypothetical protein